MRNITSYNRHAILAKIALEKGDSTLSMRYNNTIRRLTRIKEIIEFVTINNGKIPSRLSSDTDERKLYESLVHIRAIYKNKTLPIQLINFIDNSAYRYIFDVNKIHIPIIKRLQSLFMWMDDHNGKTPTRSGDPIESAHSKFIDNIRSSYRERGNYKLTDDIKHFIKQSKYKNVVNLVRGDIAQINKFKLLFKWMDNHGERFPHETKTSSEYECYLARYLNGFRCATRFRNGFDRVYPETVKYIKASKYPKTLDNNYVY